MGVQWGLTASVLTYSMVKHQGFKATPFHMTKVAGYSKVAGAFLGFYVMGHSYVMGRFGDSAQFDHLFWNKRAIVSGQMAMDK